MTDQPAKPDEGAVRYGAARVALVLGTSTASIGATEEGYRQLDSHHCEVLAIVKGGMGVPAAAVGAPGQEPHDEEDDQCDQPDDGPEEVAEDDVMAGRHGHPDREQFL